MRTLLLLALWGHCAVAFLPLRPLVAPRAAAAALYAQAAEVEVTKGGRHLFRAAFLLRAP
eukprot:scaffold2990_cov239-Pinguiococcus_pyrenoidosus.AAC.7